MFEVNEDLRQIAYGFASKANLTDDPIAADYRARYAAAPNGIYTAGSEAPSVVLCDVSILGRRKCCT